MKLSRLLTAFAALIMAVLTLFLVAKTINAFAERDYIGKAVRDRDVISINGMGKVSVKPDVAKIDFGLYSDGASVTAVQDDNTRKMNAVITAVKALGVKDADIQTSNYSLQPKIDWTNGNQRVTGYVLSQMVTLKIRDLTKVGQAIEAATNAGSNQVNSLQFTIDDPSSLQDEARIKAIADAKKKAEALAKATGLHLVKVVSFSEASPVESPIPMPYAVRSQVADKAAAPQIEAGSLDVTMNVSVMFEVR